MRLHPSGSENKLGQQERFLNSSYDVIQAIHENLTNILRYTETLTFMKGVLFFRFEAFGGQVAFTGVDATNRLLLADATHKPAVFVDGTLLDPGSVTVSEDGGTVTVSPAMVGGEEVLIAAYGTDSGGVDWAMSYVNFTGALLAANNLDELTDVPAARTALGLGSAALTSSGDYATAAQGSKADTALQPNTNVSVLALTAAGAINGRDVAADGAKLDTIAAGAQVNLTANQMLTALLAVDGSTSGLDADLLDGNHASAFATAAQGGKADTALQPATGITVVGSVESTDVDTLVGNQSVSVSSAAPNLPVAAAGILSCRQKAGDANFRTQTFVRYDAIGGPWVRHMVSGVWAAWRELLDGSTDQTITGVKTFNMPARGPFVTLTAAPTVTVDLSVGQRFFMELDQNVTMATPTNIPAAGQSFLMEFRQDLTGGWSVAWGVGWRFLGDAAPEFPVGASGLAVLPCEVLQNGEIAVGFLSMEA